MVNGHKSAAYTDSPDGGTGKMWLGGGMHCPSASSLYVLQAHMPHMSGVVPCVSEEMSALYLAVTLTRIN